MNRNVPEKKFNGKLTITSTNTETNDKTIPALLVLNATGLEHDKNRKSCLWNYTTPRPKSRRHNPGTVHAIKCI